MPGPALNLSGFGVNSALLAAVQTLIETNYIKYTNGVVTGFINSDGSVATGVDDSWDANVTYTAGTAKAQISALTALAHTIQGTANQLIITPDGIDPSILILSLPQDVGIASTPTFAGLIGKTNGGNQTAGNIGEYVETDVAVGNQVALTTSTNKTIASIVLQPGEWDVEGVIVFNGDATTTVSAALAGIGTTTDSAVGSKYSANQTRTLTVPPINLVQATPKRRVSISVATTYYLIGFCVFGTAAMNAYGNINARRIY